MSRTNTSSNRHDVAVAKCKWYSKTVIAIFMLITMVLVAARWPENAPVVIAPGGSVTVAPAEAFVAGALNPSVPFC